MGTDQWLACLEEWGCGSLNETKVRTKMYYVGADYHKDMATFCIQTASGNIKDEFEVEANSKGTDKVIDIMSGKKFRIMTETSEFSINLHNHLVSRGVESILVDPRGLKINAMSDKKTVVNDARSGEVATSLGQARDRPADLAHSYRHAEGPSRPLSLSRRDSEDEGADLAVDLCTYEDP